MCSTVPGGYSTVIINVSLPGRSDRSFCMIGTTSGCGVSACTSGVSCALAARTSIVPRIRRYDMAASASEWKKGMPRSGCLRVAKPFVETDATKACFAQRHQRALLDAAAPVSGVGVTHDLTLVAHRLQIAV